MSTSSTLRRRWWTGCTLIALIMMGIALVCWVAYLAAVYPILRDTYIGADGGECVYVGNGTASCVPVSVGGAKAVSVYNTPQSALVVNASYVGLACRPPVSAVDYDSSTALPVFRTQLGIAICVPGPADRWTLLWRGKLDGPPSEMAGVFSPHVQANTATIFLIFVCMPTAIAIAFIIIVCCIRFSDCCADACAF